MRRFLVLFAAAAVALALAGTAQAGCMATVGLASQPKDVAPGQTWSLDLNVLQHGQTPLAGATPVVIVKETTTGEERRFPAAPTSTTGRYHADVVFPQAGTWAVSVHDGFPEPQCAQTHTFGSFGIGAEEQPPSAPVAQPEPVAADTPQAAPSPSDGSFPYWALGLGVAALAAAAAALVIRASRGQPRSPQAPLPGP